MNHWQHTDKGLYRRFEFRDFSQTWAFMTEVARLAEQQRHHPEWRNSNNILEIWLNTHGQQGAITEKDTKLAAAINHLLPLP
jgi:4a-hydroxytetrahydrobiopterin dehydratase